METTEPREETFQSVSISTKSNEPFVPKSDDGRTGNVEAKQPHIESENPLPDYISFFRATLKSAQQNCICQCCTLWIASHISMGLICLLVLANSIDIIAQFGSGNYFYGILLCVYISIQLIIFIMTFRGLYICATQWIFIQYVFSWFMLVFPFTKLLGSISMGSIAMIDVVSVFINIGFTIYILMIFRRVYLWSKYFKNGGTLK
eukprot:69423_1